MDINEVVALFHIHEKASAHGSAMDHIKEYAYHMLLDENAQLKDHVEGMRKARDEKLKEAARPKAPEEQVAYIQTPEELEETQGEPDEGTASEPSTAEPTLNRRL
jgi:hypothetical protein